MQLIQKYYLPWHFPFRKEFAGIVFILLLFILFPRLVRQLDYTAAPIDPGAFSADPGGIGHADLQGRHLVAAENHLAGVHRLFGASF
jgi:hypothetical protein